MIILNQINYRRPAEKAEQIMILIVNCGAGRVLFRDDETKQWHRVTEDDIPFIWSWFGIWQNLNTILDIQISSLLETICIGRQFRHSYWVALTCIKTPSSSNDQVPESTKRCSTGVKIHRVIILPDLLRTYQVSLLGLATRDLRTRDSQLQPHPPTPPPVICACAIQSSVPVVQSSIPVVQSRVHSSLHSSPRSSYSQGPGCMKQSTLHVAVGSS